MPIIPKVQSPEHRHMIRAEVVRTRQTTPSFKTVTLAGDELQHLDHMGYDQAARLFLRRPDQPDLRMPSANNIGWTAQYYLIPTKARPFVRNYTIRRFDRHALEADIEFVLHGDESPASRWANRVTSGEPIGLYPEGTAYRSPGPGTHQLIVADESGVPAVLAILERLDVTSRVTAVLEVPTRDDIRDVTTVADVAIRWVTRQDHHCVPGQRALAALSETEYPATLRHAYIIGESGLATGARKHLVSRQHFDKKDVILIGYWKHGKSSPA
jgi:NADPH-dependent ferric siderophore reductase